MGRDFSGQNLRGRNFRGQDLRGASFVNADIRGANFTDAELQGADFTGAIAGLQKRWAIGQAILGFGLLLSLNFITVLLSALLIRFLFQETTIRIISVVPGIIVILFVLGVLFVLAKKGFTIQSFSINTIAFIITIAGAVILTLLITSLFSGVLGTVSVIAALTSVFPTVVRILAAILAAGVVASLVSVIVAVVAAVSVAGAVTPVVTSVVSGASAGIVVAAISGVSLVSLGAGITAIAIAPAVLSLGLYAAWCVNKDDEKFAVVRTLGLTFGSLGGTSFKGADLTDANFAQAKLKSANFANSRKRTTNLTRTNWNNTKKLDKAQPGNSIFSNFKVLQLLTTGQGNNQDFSQFNLRGANLNFAQLNGANLKNADLTEASLCQADLQHANLTEVQAVGTDFTQAYLTGACLEAWNIDRVTLSGIDCAFYFLRETPDPKGDRDRRPHDPDRLYEPGDAEKLLTEARDIVEVLLKHCTNAKDLAQSLQRLTESYPEATLQKIEHKDNADFLVTLTVPPETDKAQVETTLHKAYDEIRALRGEVKDLQALRAADLKDVVTALADRQSPPVNINQNINQNTGDHTMTTQDTQNITATSGSFVNTGNDFSNSGTINLGAISGTVTNAIGQLPTPETHEPDLKTALTDLQTAIESSSLSDDDKAEALEQVKTIADAGKTPKDNALHKTIKTAMKLLKGTIADLPATEDLVKVLVKIVPIVAAFFGMPAM